MPAALTGSPRWSARHAAWVARVTLPNGQREPVPMPGLAPCSSPASCSASQRCAACTEAWRMAGIVARRARVVGAVVAGTGETTNEWFDRWLASREKRGLASTANDKGRYKKWIAPLIGVKPIADVTKRDLEVLVQRLDAVVLAGEISWKTAVNVWGVATKMFDDACNSKILDLRARKDDPADGVRGPDRGSEKSGPYLFPREFLAIIACARIPSRWKRLITFALYAGLRRGEIAVLEWGDVNLEQRYIHVHRAEGKKKGEVKKTKSGETRKVPIEPSLVPLLERMHEDAGGTGRVMTSMPPREEMAKRLRRYVEWSLADAGIAIREELFADDETRRPLVWHDLRHGYATWRAAGHSDSRTTDIYINEAQTFEDAKTFGAPFPPLDLPALMALETKWAGSGQRATSKNGSSENSRAAVASPRGFEPLLAA